MKYKWFFVISSVFLFLGCSFSKDESAPSNINVPLKQDSALSNIQKNIIMAVQLNDLKKLRQTLKESKPLDLSFKSQRVTPMGLALKLNHKEAVDILLEFNADITNLGEHQKDFMLSSLLPQVQDIYTRLNFFDTASKRKSTMNSAQESILKRYTLDISIIANEIFKDNFSNAETAYFRNPFACEFLEMELTLIYLNSKQNEFGKVESFLQRIGCKPSIPSDVADELYHIELIRQFQNFFTDGTLISYLSRHPNLSKLMWNIDNSGFWVSPALLFRMAFSEENLLLTHKRRFDFCNTDSVKEAEECYIDHQSEEYRFFQKNKIVLPEFELIKTLNGSISTSYLYFKREVINSNDAFYEKASHYLHGKKLYKQIEDPNHSGQYIYSSEEMPWEIGLQEQEDGVSD